MMTNYESIFVLRPTLSDEEGEKVIAKMKGVIEKEGGQVIQTENWGRRKLAYEVKKEKKGMYVCVRFAGNGRVVSAFERNCRLDDAVVKFFTVKVEERVEERKDPVVTTGEGEGPEEKAGG